MKKMLAPAKVGLAQGAFYIAGGVWPLVGYRSFQKRTGPKDDDVLAKALAALLIIVGAVETRAALRGNPPPDVRTLGIATAATSAALDVFYVTTGRLGKVYLASAAVQVGLLASWIKATRPSSEREFEQALAGA